MRLSSGFGVVGAVWLRCAEDGVEDVGAAACGRDHCLVVALPFAPFARVEGAAGGVAERAEGGLVEHALEGFVAASGALQVADLSGLAEHGCQSGGGGELVWRGEAADAACLGDEFGAE